MPAKLDLGDCLDIVPTLPAHSCDALITDLPYGTTNSSFDKIIPFNDLWKIVKHSLKPNGVFITTAQQPFTSALIMSNLEWFRIELIYEKSVPTRFLDCHKRPLSIHENIVLFCQEGHYTYNPQMTHTKHRVRFNRKVGKHNDVYNDCDKNYLSDNHGLSFPNTIIRIQHESWRYDSTKTKTNHPTQKPVALYEYLIRTYTNPGETVLDCCMGSGTTGVACINTERNFIGIELEPEYFTIAQQRIAEAQLQPRLISEVALPKSEQPKLI